MHNLQPQSHSPRMTPQRAAAILSYQGHRGENKWWVETREEFVQGKPRLTSVIIASQSMKFHPFEAIAIASIYLQNPETAIATQHEITRPL